jgi:hypothetical protein
MRKEGRLTMRKEDRVAASQQQSSKEQPEKKSQPEPRDREQMKGSGANQPIRPQREGKKLPLPD